MVLAKALTDIQIIFIIVTAVVVVGLFLATFVTLIIIKNRRIRYRDYDYKKVYQVAFNEDFYLVNNFYFPIEDEKNACIDHILFGDKFVYLVLDYYYEGDVSGKLTDKSLIYTDKKGKKYYTDNPLLYIDAILSRFSIVSGLDTSYFIGVVIVNDSCGFKIESDSEQLFATKRKDFSKLIKKIESRNIAKLKADELDALVKSVANTKKSHK